MKKKEVVLDDHEADVTDDKYRAATERGRIAAETEPRAIAAHYDRESRRLVVDLRSGVSFMVPAQFIPGLESASEAERAEVQVIMLGKALQWKSINEGCLVPALATRLLGNPIGMAELARRGGQSRSPARAASSRANGMKGGRPKREPVHVGLKV